MEKKQKILIEKALKSLNKKNRLQELAGLTPTGCIGEHLDPTSPEGIKLKTELKRTVNFMNGILYEVEDGASEIPSELCMKDVVFTDDGGSATACNSSCSNNFPLYLCNNCTCYTISVGTSGNPIGPMGPFAPVGDKERGTNTTNTSSSSSKPNTRPERDKLVRTEAENASGVGKCIGQVVQSGTLGNQLTFKTCGPCKTGTDCPEGCACAKEKGGGK